MRLVCYFRNIGSAAVQMITPHVHTLTNQKQDSFSNLIFESLKVFDMLRQASLLLLEI